MCSLSTYRHINSMWLLGANVKVCSWYLGCFKHQFWVHCFCHNLILFLFHSYNKILLDFCFTHVVFMFLFFLFHDLDLELGLHVLLFWFRKYCKLGYFHARYIFVYYHVPRWFTCWAPFCSYPLLCFALLFWGFPFLFLPFFG